MKELRFASTDEALQHLANVTGKKIKVADKTGAERICVAVAGTKKIKDKIKKVEQGLKDIGNDKPASKEDIVALLKELEGLSKDLEDSVGY